MHLKRIALALIACVFLLVKSDPIRAQTAAISTFASSPTERAANYEIHIARRKTAGLDSYYRQVLAETNPWGEIGRRFVYLQMDERDLVDIVAYFWIHTHGLSTNLMPNGISQRNYEQVASHGTWRAVRGQVQTMFDNEKAMEGLSNSVRQRYADSVMFEIVFQQQALIKAMDKGNEDSGTRAAFIALNRSMIGFDITKAALGPGGFFARPGSSEKFPFSALEQKPALAPSSSKIGSTSGPTSSGPAIAPRKDIPPIIGVFYHSEVRMLIGGSPEFNSSYVEETETILFAGGTACENCHTAWTQGPAAFAALKRQKPGDFGTWKVNASGSTVTIGGRTENFKRADQFHGGRAGTKITGILTTTGGRLTEGGYLGSTDYMQFLPSGRFNLLNDPAERQTRPKLMGRYTVSGDYRLRLEYDDGRTEIHGLAISADDPNFLIIGGTAYYEPKETN
jgi:hypothetical protein